MLGINRSHGGNAVWLKAVLKETHLRIEAKLPESDICTVPVMSIRSEGYIM